MTRLLLPSGVIGCRGRAWYKLPWALGVRYELLAPGGFMYYAVVNVRVFKLFVVRHQWTWIGDSGWTLNETS